MQLFAKSLLFALALLGGAAAQAETPQVEWIRQIGTSSQDESLSVAVDAVGNAYISGRTSGSLGGANMGDYDAFLTKFDSSGNELWTEQFGTSSNDASYSVAVDAAGNVYISGFTFGSLGGANAGSADAFLTKFDSSGNELWTEQIGTIDDDYSSAVAVDAAGNAYISGTTSGSLGGANVGGYDAFLTKFDSSGNELWTEQIGTSRFEFSTSLAVDAAGNAYISGSTTGSLGGPSAGFEAVFLTKFDSSGNELWTAQVGTGTSDGSRSVAVDATGNAYISGFTHGSLGGANAGVDDAFLMKFDSRGDQLWTEQFGTNGHDYGNSVAIDTAGNAYISGLTNGSLAGTNAGNTDAFLTKFDSSGNQLWTEQIGTRSFDRSDAVAVDAAGNAYISGFTLGNLGGINAGGYDAFLVKYRVVPEPTAAVLAAVTGMAALASRRR